MKMTDHIITTLYFVMVICSIVAATFGVINYFQNKATEQEHREAGGEELFNQLKLASATQPLVLLRSQNETMYCMSQETAVALATAMQPN